MSNLLCSLCYFCDRESRGLLKIAAEFAFFPCGHYCVCAEHERQRDLLGVCPLCPIVPTSVKRVRKEDLSVDTDEPCGACQFQGCTLDAVYVHGEYKNSWCGNLCYCAIHAHMLGTNNALILNHTCRICIQEITNDSLLRIHHFLKAALSEELLLKQAIYQESLLNGRYDNVYDVVAGYFYRKQADSFGDGIEDRNPLLALEAMILEDKTALAIAAIEMHPEIINNEVGLQSTLLMEAVAAGNIVLVEAFLRAGAEVDKNFLLDDGPELDEEELDQSNAFLIAIHKGDLPMVQILLDAGASVNYIDDVSPLPLNVAVKHGYTAIVQLLLNNGADVNALNDDSQSALHFASILDVPEIAVLLLDRDADIHDTDEHTMTPVHAAAQNNSPNVLRVLINRGGDINLSGIHNFTPLHVASRFGNPAITSVLIESRANLNMLDDTGKSPLLLALHKNYPDVATQLIIAGADLEVKDSEEKTALFLAVEKNDEELVALLVSRNANVLAANWGGYTPLSTAVLEDNLTLVRLLAAPDNVERIMTRGWMISNALDDAANQSTAILAFLFSLSSNEVNIRRRNATNALYYAALGNNVNNVLLLLDLGADPHFEQPSNSHSAISVAQEFNCAEVFAILRNL
jgi:ankyrin repeat protein